jgi:hypothetical protein
VEDLSLSTLIWLRMARFVQNSNQVSNEYLRQFGITVAQFEALAHIRNFQPITQSDLAAGLTVSGGGISTDARPPRTRRADPPGAGVEDERPRTPPTASDIRLPHSGLALSEVHAGHRSTMTRPLVTGPVGSRPSGGGRGRSSPTVRAAGCRQ